MQIEGKTIGNHFLLHLWLSYAGVVSDGTVWQHCSSSFLHFFLCQRQQQTHRRVVKKGERERGERKTRQKEATGTNNGNFFFLVVVVVVAQSTFETRKLSMQFQFGQRNFFFTVYSKVSTFYPLLRVLAASDFPHIKNSL